MQNKPTDMQTMADTMSAAEIEKVQKEAMSQLISATGAMMKLKKQERGEYGYPSPFEVIGWISANLTEPVMSCYNTK